MSGSIAKRTDRTFVDAHGVTIHYYVWEASEPKAVVQLVHGLGEHALRYERLARDLVGAGYTVWADDHRGHGATGMAQHGGDPNRLGRLGPGGMRATIEQVRRVTALIRETHPGRPVALLGHSWGSLLAQIIANRHPDEIDALVLSGTALRTLRFMNSGDLNKRHRHLGSHDYEWLSRDRAVVQAAEADPLMFVANAAKLFGIRDGLRLLGRPARNIEHDIPVLILIGSDDTLGGEESVSRLAADYVTRSGLSDVKAIVYPDARHEVFNETNRDEVVADLVAWLDSRVADLRS